MNKELEEKLKKTAERLGLTLDQMPRHIAIIMDGNGRWAQSRGLPRVEGHNKGGQVVETIALDCVALGIEVLTLYSFSIENWKRPKEEIDGLMHLYIQYLVGIRNILMKNNVKLIHLGRMATLPGSVRKELLETMRLTESNTGMILALALNYAGRAEIVDATKKIAEEYKQGKIQLDDINEQTISNNLYTAGLNDPDLLIRTANELRVSNFLLWQISYSEFYVTETYWPDFVKEDLEKAIAAYANRDRRFGNIGTIHK
ncbi:MAG: isoprenyl transferase [Sedimentisphaerales bacterium]|nr:isoprenyl transferase [Sedimentisphaerales bacterium]